MRFLEKFKGLAIPLLICAATEIAVRALGVKSDNFAAPSEVALALWRAKFDPQIFNATRHTLGAAATGLALGGGLGLAAGIALGLSKAAFLLSSLTIEVLRPVPSVALIPIAMLVFGFGYPMEISIIAFACIWPMLLLTRSAVTNVEPRLIEVARMLRLSKAQEIGKIVLPAMLPRVFVAFRLAAGVSLVVAVTVEIAINPFGLGYEMSMAQQTLRPALMLAILAWISVLGWGVNALLIACQKMLFVQSAGGGDA